MIYPKLSSKPHTLEEFKHYLGKTLQYISGSAAIV